MIKTQSVVFPDNWNPNCTKTMNKWFESLPELEDYEIGFKTDVRYEYLKLKK